MGSSTEECHLMNTCSNLPTTRMNRNHSTYCRLACLENRLVFSETNLKLERGGQFFVVDKTEFPHLFEPPKRNPKKPNELNFLRNFSYVNLMANDLEKVILTLQV